MGYVLVSDIDHPQVTAERISELFLYTFPMWVVFIIIEFYKEKKKYFSILPSRIVYYYYYYLIFFVPTRYGHDYLNDHNVECKLKIMFARDSK
jgi:hypothetical protein